MIIDIPTVEGGVFIDGGPNTLGTIVRASFLNSLMKSSTATTKEIETILTKNGIQPDDRVYDQLFKAIGKMITDGKVVLTDVLGTSKTLAASQFLVNEVNKLALLGKEKADLVGIQANNNAKEIEKRVENLQVKNAFLSNAGSYTSAVATVPVLKAGSNGLAQGGAFLTNNQGLDFTSLNLKSTWLYYEVQANYASDNLVATFKGYNSPVLLQATKRAGADWSKPIVFADASSVLSVGDFGLGGKLSLTGNIFDQEFSGFYRDQSATLYPTSSNINALSVGYGAGRMNGIMFQAASLDAWIFENATRKTAKIITTADLDSLIQVPVDQIFYFDSATPPTGYIARNGQAIDKAKMPKLFAKYGANMPDDRDRVHRMTGTLAGAVGTTQEDAIRNITGILGDIGNYTSTRDSSSGAFIRTGAEGMAASNGNSSQGGVRWDFDASRVVPTAAENRVKSRIILACNKIQ